MDRRVSKLSSRNAVISPLDLPFQAAVVLNPGAVEQADEIVLLFRGDWLQMYHGTADTCTCPATAELDHVPETLEKRGDKRIDRERFRR